MITLRRFVLQSLWFHRRAHLGIILGATFGSAALIGALLVGDSVRESLKERAHYRLGAAHFALNSGDRLFTTNLAYALGSPTDTAMPARPEVRIGWNSLIGIQNSAMAFNVRGTVARQDGAARAHNVQIYGTDARFWRFAPSPNETGLPAILAPTNLLPSSGKVRINSSLATQLKVSPGETLILRFSKPSALPRDAALAGGGDANAALRLIVDEIVTPEAFGDFDLLNSQKPALNAFVNLDDLWRAAGVRDRGNIILARGAERIASLDSWRAKAANWARRNANWLPANLEDALLRLRQSRASTPESLTYLSNKLDLFWNLPDSEIQVRVIPPPASSQASPSARAMVEISTPRIFLDREVALAATRPDPSLPDADQEERAWMRQGMPLTTYLANAIRAGDRLTPYSMVTAVGPPWTPADLPDDQIVVTDWLAEDLVLKAGDSVELTYFDPELGAQLVERTHRFQVHSVVPLTGIYADKSLMPEFPGLANAEKTTDWDAGFPLVHELRPKDETYWHDHRGTPRAYVNLRIGKQLWGNRFGEVTAVRHWVPTNQSPENFKHTVSTTLRAGLRAGELGLVFQPVEELARKAATSGQDFGQLFLGFSFFLLIAALLLMALLFQFGLEQRLPEIGTLLALGFRPKRIRRLWLTEGLWLAAAGALLGVPAGWLYAKAMIVGLTTIWSSAVAGATLEFHATAVSLAIGILASTLVCTFTIWLTLRRQVRRPARALLAGEISNPSRGKSRHWPLWIGIAAVLAAFALAGSALSNPTASRAPIFFGIGFLLLVGGLALSAACLGRSKKEAIRDGGRVSSGGPLLTLPGLAARGMTRRRSRSLATAGLLASGTFIIAAIGAFRLDAGPEAERRNSGTGGFALIGETSIPILQDLNTSAGLDHFGLSTNDLPGVGFVPFRVRDGDDASCLNLNRAQRPRLLGVRPERLAERHAFAFASAMPHVELTNAWISLKTNRTGSSTDETAGAHGAGIPEIPAIGDAASIQWALGNRVGGTVDMTDERGSPFRLRLVAGLANSILQGSLVIDEEALSRLFPSEAGYRFFLIDAPRAGIETASETLSRAMADEGLALTPAVRRLAELNAVQNTYLTTFQVLGGLGLLLGSAGLGVVVLRNVLERRAELAVLAATGFRTRLLSRLVLLEHAGLLALGLGIGVLSAAIAVLPALLAPQVELPFLSLGLTLAGVVFLGLTTAWVATRLSLRGRILNALHGE